VLSWIKRRFAGEEKPTRSSIGSKGEREAERFLKSKGFRVLARNWRAGKDEIDLICKDERTLVFVETRTRRSGALVGGYDSINLRKRNALKRVCRAYLAKLKPPPDSFRLDIVEVEHEEGEILATRHYENAALFHKETGRGH